MHNIVHYTVYLHSNNTVARHLHQSTCERDLAKMKARTKAARLAYLKMLRAVIHHNLSIAARLGFIM